MAYATGRLSIKPGIELGFRPDWACRRQFDGKAIPIVGLPHTTHPPQPAWRLWDHRHLHGSLVRCRLLAMKDSRHLDKEKDAGQPDCRLFGDPVVSEQSSNVRFSVGSLDVEPSIVARREVGTKTPARTRGWRDAFSSLHSRSFLYLWLGMVVMMGGLQMQMLAQSYLVYDITGSASLLGLVSAGSAIPLLGLSLFGGAIADRLERKRIIQAGQAVSMVLALVVGAAITTNTITWYYLMAASVVSGATFAFMMPARQAIIPQLVGQDQVTNAIALSSAGMSAMTLASPAIAGVLYALLGPDKVYYIVSGMGLCAVLLTGLIPKTSVRPRKADAAMVRDIADGLSYVRHSPLVLVLLIISLATALLAMPIRSLMPVFVVDVYHRGSESMGLLLAFTGAGALVGSLFIASLGRWRRGLLLILGSFVSGIALLLLAVVPHYLAAAAIMIILGLGDSVRRTLNQSLVMEEVEDQYRGRVMSVFMMNFGLTPLGVLPAGVVADLLGGQVAMGILAVLLLATSSVILVTQKRLRETT